MYSYLLQDWKTVNLDLTMVELVQSEFDWMSFQPFSDIVFWLDVRAITCDGGSNLFLDFQTAPAKEDGLFAAMATSTLAVSGVVAAPVPILLAGNPAVPLARWVRWRLRPSVAQNANWGATFRIHCSANAVGAL